MNQIIIKIIQKFYLEKIKKKKNDFFLLNLMKKLIILLINLHKGRSLSCPPTSQIVNSKFLY